jgi:tRNA-specific 2-thiouridylase
MFKKYKQGITPNPDVLCNEKIKFPLLWKAAKKLKAQYLVTGHYARIKKTKKGYEMLRAKDETKDQSYFLYRLTQEDLSHTLFPIGEYTKKEIRAIAEKNKFPNYNKKSTVGICFIGKINLKDFLKKKISPKKGKILDPNGNQIGEHDGIYYYTIGQRLGSRYGIEVSKVSDDKRQLKRWYVARKDAKKNIIVAAPEGHKILFRKNIIVKEPHWINSDKKPARVLARIRQVGELLPATLNKNKIVLHKAITGVSEGQAIVLYQGTKVLGGGTISF